MNITNILSYFPDSVTVDNVVWNLMVFLLLNRLSIWKVRRMWRYSYFFFITSFIKRKFCFLKFSSSVVRFELIWIRKTNLVWYNHTSFSYSSIAILIDTFLYGIFTYRLVGFGLHLYEGNRNYSYLFLVTRFTWMWLHCIENPFVSTYSQNWTAV